MIKIFLHDQGDLKRLNHVFCALANDHIQAIDIAKEDGFECADLRTFVLTTTSKMRFERVTILPSSGARWTKTLEGWSEASELLQGLVLHSHQYLGDGDAIIKVILGAE